MDWYISPPSHLSNPIPSHLISLPLLQRHHFLSIHPAEDPLSYLSWPSPDQNAAFHRLDSLSVEPDLTDSTFLRVCYTADQESVFAHAELRCTTEESAGIRLVFLWDGRDEAWKYHNVALMPFPPNATESIPNFPLPENTSSSHDFLQADVDFVDPSEDAYWDAYGKNDDEHESHVRPSKEDTHAGSEDAYWAQYASVQGSGDSTLPSPLPASKQKLQSIGNETSYSYHDDHTSHYNQNGIQEAAHEPILDIPYASLNIQPSVQPYDPHSPPSPTDLSDRLKAVSSRDDEHNLKLNGLVNGNGHAHNRSTSVTPIPPPSETRVVNGFHPVPQPDNCAENIALKSAIAGTYQLWKSSRLASAAKSNLDSDQEHFLQLVREAISR